MGDLPTGTVTFLFTDVEGSTQLLERHGRLLSDALARHHRLLAEAVDRHGGTVFETVGDAVYAVFVDPAQAVAAGVDMHAALAAEDWGSIGRLAARIAVHTGHVERLGRHYSGPALFRAARLQAIGHGEQTLLSDVTAQLVREALPPGASLRSLGQHRLKDLAEPEEVHDIVHPALRQSFPPLKSVGAHPSNLPQQLTSFVGRAAELAAVDELLDRQRLVTLIGPGGVGKTRLALEVTARRLERHAGGAWFVDLSGAADASAIPATITAALGLRELPGRSLTEVVAEHLDGRDALIVLDNVEQLLPDAAGCLGQLIGATESVTILATSRAPLRLRGEHVFTVPPLRTAGDEQASAVALFRERARSIGQELRADETTTHVIAEVCELCDGLPLAIELAAARLSVFELADLRSRLMQRLPLLVGGARDAPARQQTLRGAIAWSVELLPPDERRLFAILGAFVGGFGVDAVETMAAEVSGIDPTAALAELVSQSLVQRSQAPAGHTRYAMLETIREYALQMLDDLEREATFENHAQWLVQRARTLLPLSRPADRDSLEELTLDLENIRAAYQRQISGPTRLALAGATWRVWHTIGLLQEGLRWTEEALAGQPAASRDRALALRGAAVLHSHLGDESGALALGTEALHATRRLGDDRLTAQAINMLGALETNPDRAASLFTEAIQLEARLGTPAPAPHLNLGWVAGQRGDMQAAVGWYRRGLELAQRIDDHGAAAASLTGLAWLALIRDDHDEATKWAEGAYEAGWRSGEPLWWTEALVQLAHADLQRGNQLAAAQRVHAACLELEHGEWLAVRDEVLTAAAEVLLTDGSADRAALLLGAAEPLREPVTGVWLERERAAERLLSRALEADASAVAAHARGRDLGAREAISLATSWLSEWLAPRVPGSTAQAE